MSVKHLVSWNVNGIRAILKKGFAESVQAMAPDVLCLQETKASKEETLAALENVPGYVCYANSSKARKGYSGTAILSREMPLRVMYDMGIEKFDREGRVTVAEYAHYFVATVYTPNSGEALARLPFRGEWDKAFREYMAWLGRRKPVIMCGDFNVAHQPIDLARPKENYDKTAGYTQQEIDGFTELLAHGGFVDTFRYLYPETVQYSYWSFMFGLREKNVGWRIDYFLLQQKMLEILKDAFIYDQRQGSDHCPVGIKIAV